MFRLFLRFVTVGIFLVFSHVRMWGDTVGGREAARLLVRQLQPLSTTCTQLLENRVRSPRVLAVADSGLGKFRAVPMILFR